MSQVKLMLQDSLFSYLPILLQIDSVKDECSSIQTNYDISRSRLVTASMECNYSHVCSLQISQNFGLTISVVQVVVVTSITHYKAMPSFWI